MYHHTVSGLSSVESVQQYDYNDHIEEYYWSKIKVVGPNYYDGGKLIYQATIGRGPFAFGDTPDEAKAELMEKMGF